MNPLTQRYINVAPYELDGNIIDKILQDFDSGATEVELNNENQRRISLLWQAAHDLENASISGSAIGLVTLGILSKKPKATTVQDWIHSIWALYYERKANGSYDIDFSIVGECPHTVPELVSE